MSEQQPPADGVPPHGETPASDAAGPAPGTPTGWSPPGPPGAAPPPGYQQPPVVVVQQKSNTGLIIGIIVAVVLLLLCVPVVAILAVTFLGRSASSKFSSVGSTIGDIKLVGAACVPMLWRFRLHP